MTEREEEKKGSNNAIGAEAIKSGALRLEPFSAEGLEAFLERSGVGLGVEGPEGKKPWELPSASFRVWLARALVGLHPANLALWRAYRNARAEYWAAATAVARAQQCWDAPEHASARRALERAVQSTARLEHTVDNLAQYVAAGCPPRVPQSEAKKKDKDKKEVNVEALVQSLAAKQATLSTAREERDALLAAAPPAYAELQAAQAALEAVCAANGITAAEEGVRALNSNIARQSHRNGAGMEAAVAASWRDALRLPGVESEDEKEGEDQNQEQDCKGRLFALQNVTLGTRAMEFDVVIVRDNGAGEPVTCVAVVEVKYNANDVGASFAHHQRSLAWLCGCRDAYDPARYTSPRFPTGHFDRPAVHRAGPRDVVFAPASFAHWARDPASGHFLAGLYFAVHMDPAFRCAGCPSSLISRLAATATTPPSVRAIDRYSGEAVADYNFDDPAATPEPTVRAIAEFLAAASDADDSCAVSTADVFRLYLRAGLADHIIRYFPQSPPMTNK